MNRVHVTYCSIRGKKHKNQKSKAEWIHCKNIQNTKQKKQNNPDNSLQNVFYNIYTKHRMLNILKAQQNYVTQFHL